MYFITYVKARHISAQRNQWNDYLHKKPVYHSSNKILTSPEPRKTQLEVVENIGTKPFLWAFSINHALSTG
jgi:hypothetical protein